ncbi:hypothetical protein D7Z26_26670 [Cohnella endophytica]|uniref:Uncharacterized protein n=1 Tax=Cohnella endophytica TaxID=2419778 RepID=A0A494X829_9BACL|nr:hypothetical protein [Cohnella endophytica]RKP44496.1 hypothetical protein D7Z26_26670 [Cohnella endophytica]
MALQQIIRAFTLVGILCSIVLLGSITYQYFDPSPIELNIIMIIAFCPLFLGVISSYLVQAEQLGRFGLISFIVLTAGYLLGGVGLNWAVAFVSPVYGELTPAGTVQSANPPFPIIQGMASSFILLNLGMLLYGIAILRSSQTAKWSGVMFLLSIVGALAPPMDSKCIYFFCAGIIWIGIKGWNWKPTNQANANEGASAMEHAQQKTVPYP